MGGIDIYYFLFNILVVANVAIITQNIYLLFFMRMFSQMNDYLADPTK